MFQVEPFKPEHLQTLEPGEHDKAALLDAGILELTSWAEGLSAIKDGRCLGCLFVGIEKGVGTVILIGSDELRERHGAQLGVMLIRGMNNARKLGVSVLQGKIEPEFTTAREFARRLGFIQSDDLTFVKVL